MTDYARVAEVLKEMASELDELYHHLSVPRRKQALTAAAALCEARAAPIDAAKERAEFEKWWDLYNYSAKLTLWDKHIAGEGWLARARSDARTALVEKEADLDTALKQANRAGEIIYAMSEALKPVAGEHNIDLAKRIRAERDALEAENTRLRAELTEMKGQSNV